MASLFALGLSQFGLFSWAGGIGGPLLVLGAIFAVCRTRGLDEVLRRIIYACPVAFAGVWMFAILEGLITVGGLIPNWQQEVAKLFLIAALLISSSLLSSVDQKGRLWGMLAVVGAACAIPVAFLAI
jgi:hypothetical protein